ncbi:BrnA antitoxin family protein [Cyanothece sp. BG0011]|uniref:BrnA antitoxin family protein n=1 Tax=Cyanothece sp. BG0011 TaxID=2082950 RepID=UPI000D1D64DC|nr:BrnA antitoxin family protein [Cyanothece sp. BG0011]
MNNNQFNLDMSPEERHRKLVNMSDEDIDYSDIPELDEEFFKGAKLVKRNPATESISIRVDTETLEWFRNTAKNNPEIRGYQTLINDVLRTYVAHQVSKGQTSHESSNSDRNG